MWLNAVQWGINVVRIGCVIIQNLSNALWDETPFDTLIDSAKWFVLRGGGWSVLTLLNDCYFAYAAHI